MNSINEFIKYLEGLEQRVLGDFMRRERLFAKDLTKLIISFTPWSGFISAGKFFNKWILKKGEDENDRI